LMLKSDKSSKSTAPSSQSLISPHPRYVSLIRSSDRFIPNFQCVQDASWILPASSPLKCTCPADVYLLLKSSDFVSHDLSKDTVFEGCEFVSPDPSPTYELELVLRKWYSVDRSREFRCFVRQDVLLGPTHPYLTNTTSDPVPGISQRDFNYYDFLNEPATRAQIVTAVEQFWQTNIQGTWESNADCEPLAIILQPATHESGTNKIHSTSSSHGIYPVGT
jgi:hypothetical protein